MIQPAPKCYECKFKYTGKWSCEKYKEIPFFIIAGTKCDYFVEKEKK